LYSLNWYILLLLIKRQLLARFWSRYPSSLPMITVENVTLRWNRVLNFPR
jgi:hypothetical protein